MRTRNSNFLNKSNVTIPRRRNKGRTPNIVEPELRTIVAPMAERTMEELLRAPTEGYGEAIVLPEINADHFEIKMNLLQLVQANPFHGLENENPHAHINSFKRITSTLRFRNVPNDVIKLMMFPYSLEGAAKTWWIVSKLCLNSGTLPSNTIPNPKGEIKAITTRSGVAYEGPLIPTNPSSKKVVEREIEKTTNKEQSNFQGSTAQIPPSVTPIPTPEPDVPKNLPKPNNPYPSRCNDQKSRDKASNQMEKILQIIQDLRFDISFADALLLMPRFSPTIKSLLMNKEKLPFLRLNTVERELLVKCPQKAPEKAWRYRNFLLIHVISREWMYDHSLDYLVAEHKSYALFYLEKAFFTRTYTNSDDFGASR
ncbi:hypothetical protein Tco_0345541 [Tanacetum coccineum]